MPPLPSPRSGTVLIIVAGICALLAAMALTFLAQMRTDIEESDFVVQHAQAKIMLAAGCNYIQETSRIGWDRTRLDPRPAGIPSVDGLTIHEEAFGWVDVRTGKTGPFNRDGVSLMSSDASEWPHIGTHVRCPMYVRTIPPYATSLATGSNPILTSDASSPDYAYPLMRYPDPQPLDNLNHYDHATPGSVTDAQYERFAKGDPTPITQTLGRSWFRVFRDGPETFIVTCGSGATQGFKDWDDDMTPTDKAQFQTREFFYQLKSAEVRLFYRVEWTAAGVETSYQNLQHEIARTHDHYESWPPNASHAWSSSRRTQTWLKSPVGTIRWIQRLTMEPKYW